MLWGIKTEWKYSYACMWMFGPGGPAFSTAFFIEYIFVWFWLNLHRIHMSSTKSKKKLSRYILSWKLWRQHDFGLEDSGKNNNNHHYPSLAMESYRRSPWDTHVERGWCSSPSKYTPSILSLKLNKRAWENPLQPRRMHMFWCFGHPMLV